jgi:hypothetical protein
MDELTHAFALLVATSDNLGRDVWKWFLANFNMIAIVGAYRFWSMSEHRKTARALEKDREKLAAELVAATASLAELVAATAKSAASQSHNENTQLATKIDANTEISTRAFHEANSVKETIAAIGAEQVVLAAQHNAQLSEMKKDRKDD